MRYGLKAAWTWAAPIFVVAIALHFLPDFSYRGFLEGAVKWAVFVGLPLVVWEATNHLVDVYVCWRFGFGRVQRNERWTYYACGNTWTSSGVGVRAAALFAAEALVGCVLFYGFDLSLSLSRFSLI